jgi:DNA-binding SARP family transcriptional activator
MTIEVRVIGCFGLRVDGVRVDVSAVPARIVAYLAVHPVPVCRSTLASVLWPDVPRDRALGNLRSALWRLPGGSRAAVSEDGGSLRLAEDVRCDLGSALRGVRTSRRELSAEPELRDLLAWAWRDELLAGWYDDWVLEARDTLQVRRAVYLEDLANASRSAGRRADSLMYATLAVGAQPLRESAHRALLRAHIDLGHVGEAWGLYREFETMLHQEVGARPSSGTVALVASLPADGRVEVA